MKNNIFFFVWIFVGALSVSGQNELQKYGLPELHSIKTVTLSPSYSCRSTEEFSKGYADTALFLSAYARQRNSPDLLFNGACNSESYFEAATSGDSFSLISDLGTNISLEEISARQAFNVKRINTFSNYSKFAQNVKVESNHAYAVLLNESYKRGLFIFKVVEFTPNEKVVLQYAVKSYQISLSNPLGSEGFDWRKINK